MKYWDFEEWVAFSGIVLVVVLVATCVIGIVSQSGERTTVDIQIDPGATGVTEWISPDGVHYWQYSGYHMYALTPRYDKKGQLVIDKE